MKDLKEKAAAEAAEIEKIKQRLKAKEQGHAKTLTKIREQDRKEENHRKFTNAGELEKYLGSDLDASRVGILAQMILETEKIIGRKVQVSDIEKYKNFLLQQEKRGEYFTKAMNGDFETGV